MKLTAASTGWRAGDSADDRAEAMKNDEAKLKNNPSGLLIYHPPGAISHAVASSLDSPLPA